jgi:putative PIN family toxin of toxin-antitoxin system
MRVFLDTNVLASAAATRGLCADVLREVFASHELFISEQVLNELKSVLGSKFRIGQDLIDDFIWLLQQDTALVRPARAPRVELQDKDDLPILGAAIEARAEVLVTGDRELLDLGHIEDIEILSPRQFWEKLRAQQRRGAGRGKPRRPR